jgi:hypothetical protein
MVTTPTSPTQACQLLFDALLYLFRFVIIDDGIDQNAILKLHMQPRARLCSIWQQADRHDMLRLILAYKEYGVLIIHDAIHNCLFYHRPHLLSGQKDIIPQTLSSIRVL